MTTQREIEVLAGEAKELERKLVMEREERERLEGVVRDRERRLSELQSSVEAERSSNSMLVRGGGGAGGAVSVEESLRERLMAEERERERAEQELRTLRREREAEAGSPVPKMGLLTEASGAVVQGSPVKEGASDSEGLRNLVAQWEVLTPEPRDLSHESWVPSPGGKCGRNLGTLDPRHPETSDPDPLNSKFQTLDPNQFNSRPQTLKLQILIRSTLDPRPQTLNQFNSRL